MMQLRICALLILMSVSAGCGFRRTYASSKAPNGERTVRVQTPRFSGGQLRISSDDSWFGRTLFTSEEKRNPIHVDIVWTPDSRMATVLECDKDIGELVLSYDFQSGSIVTDKPARDHVTNFILQQYKPSAAALGDYEGNAIWWLCGEASNGRIPKS